MTVEQEYTTDELIPYVGDYVVIDCGDGIHGSFGGAELSGILHYQGNDRFSLCAVGCDNPNTGEHTSFDSADVLFIERIAP